MGPSFSRYALLGARERARALRALLAIAAMGPRGRDALDDVSFGDWLRDHGQDDAAIERFWDLIVLPTCNDRSDRVSAALAMFVLTEGLMRTRGNSAIGWSLTGLSHLVDAPTRWLLMKRGGEVITGTAVTHAHNEGVMLDDGREITADAVVLAPVTDGRWSCVHWGAQAPPFYPEPDVHPVEDALHAADPMG
jgi:phytoene dehydrogenase-like protein